MKSRGISEWRLAEETGVSQSTINAIFTGRSKEQKDSTLEPLAAYFECSLSQLRGYEAIEGIHEGRIPDNQYPVVTDREIEGWIGEEYAREYFSEFVRSAHPRGRRCFVFIANDDAMAPVIPMGRKVFIDPDLAQAPEDRRIMLIESGGYYSLREEFVDLGTTVYKPMAPGFRTILAADCRRMGVVVGIPEENWAIPKN